MPPKRKKGGHKRNTTGLRNHKQPPSPPRIPSEEVNDPEPDDSEDEEWDPHVHTDSLKSDWMGGSDDEGAETGEKEGEVIEDGVDACWNDGPSDASEGLFVKMMQFAIEEDDDPRDETWMPAGLRAKGVRKRNKNSRKGMKYKGGRNPDIGSKAPRTQRGYKSLLKDQTSLTKDYGFRLDPQISETVKPKSVDAPPPKSEAFSPPPSVSLQLPRSPSVPIRQETPDDIPLHFSDPPIRQESMTPALSWDDVDHTAGAYQMLAGGYATPPPDSHANTNANSPRTEGGESDAEINGNGKRRASISVGDLEASVRQGDASGAEVDEETAARDGIEDWEDELDHLGYPHNPAS